MQVCNGWDMFNGSIRLFRLLGITVYLHWSWFVIALFMIGNRRGAYSGLSWNAMEYVSIFAIVLMHEFGHALACRSVGGRADTIMLWPLGGVAYVNPPMRPGAVLWSIFAGPLVNIVLLPVTIGAMYWSGTNMPHSNLHQYLTSLAYINGALLIFNMMPVYPLDGGQILQSILWFFMGYARSLRIVSVIGLMGAAGLILLAMRLGFGPMTYVIAIFIGMQAYNGFIRARQMAQDQAEDRARTQGNTSSSYPPGWQQVPPTIPPGEGGYRRNPGDVPPPKW